MAIGAILKILQGTLFPVIDKAVVDKDAARKLQFDLQMAVMAMDTKELDAATSIIIAEAGGESWLQRNWRPISMLWFIGLVGAYWLGLAPPYLITNPEVVERLFSIVQVGLGGYVVGRSAEKIVESYKEPEKIRAKNGAN